MGPGRDTTSPHSFCWTSSPARRWSLTRDPSTLAQEPVCLRWLPMACRLLIPKSTCRPAPSFPQFPVRFPSRPPHTQTPEGALVAGGWHVSTASSMHTPGWAVTVPGLSPNSAQRPEWEPGAGEVRQRKYNSLPSHPARARGAFPGLPEVRGCLGLQPRFGRLQLFPWGQGFLLLREVGCPDQQPLLAPAYSRLPRAQGVPG